MSPQERKHILLLDIRSASDVNDEVTKILPTAGGRRREREKEERRCIITSCQCFLLIQLYSALVRFSHIPHTQGATPLALYLKLSPMTWSQSHIW